MLGFMCMLLLSWSSVLTTGNGFLLDSKPAPSMQSDGVYFYPNHMIRLTFADGEFPAKSLSYFRVRFQTKKKQGILLQIRDASNMDYISLQMNNAGGVKYFVDIGGQKYEINLGWNNIDYTDGLPHDVRVNLSPDGRITMEISTEGADANRTKADQSATAIGKVSLYAMNFTLNNPKYLFIGNNDTYYSYNGFEGCITHLQIDNFFPLHAAFQDPRPSYLLNVFGDRWFQPNTCGCVIKVWHWWSPTPNPVPEKPLYSAQQMPMKVRPNMLVRYSLNRSLEYYINSANTLVHVMFVTDVSQGTLARIGDSDDSYLSLDLTDNGTVTFSFHDGAYEFSLNISDKVNVADGQLHDLRLFRYSGQTQIGLEVDGNSVYDFLDCNIQNWLEDRKNYLYIGNIDPVEAVLVLMDVSLTLQSETTIIRTTHLRLSMSIRTRCTIKNIYADLKGQKENIICTMDNVRGDCLGPPYDTAPSAVIADLMFNLTTQTDYIRSICGMKPLTVPTPTPTRESTSVASDDMSE